MGLILPVLLNSICTVIVLLVLFWINEKLGFKLLVPITAIVMLILLGASYYFSNNMTIMIISISVALVYMVMLVVYGYEYIDKHLLIVYVIAIAAIGLLMGLLSGNVFMCIAVAVLEIAIVMISLILIRAKEKMLLDISVYGMSTALFAVLSMIVTGALSINRQLIDGKTLVMSIVLTIVGTMFVYLVMHVTEKYNEISENFKYINDRYEVDKIEKMYEEARKLRHDIKNCIVTAEGFMDDGDNEKAKEYLNDMVDKKVNVFAYSRFCDNNVLNYMINSKVAKAREYNVSMKCVVFGTLDKIEDVDISILIGNLLDNAIEAAAKSWDKKVSLEIYDKRNVSITIENSVSTNILAKNPLLRTTKRDKSNHGIGVKSVRDIVDKYNGEIRYEYSLDNTLICKVMLLKKR